MEKRNKIIHWITTSLFSAMMLMGAGMYVFNHEMVKEMFTSLGYPTYIIYPLGAAKTLGVIAILTKKSELLTEWAYAGFVFVLLLASSAHLNVADGAFAPPLVALALVLTSRFFLPETASNEV